MRKQEFWVARDGKPFAHPVECRQHEAELDLRAAVNKEFGSYAPPGLVDWLLRNYVLMPRAVVDAKVERAPRPDVVCRMPKGSEPQECVRCGVGPCLGNAKFWPTGP